jgi:succinoglycan biosynthesis transport protein ExoP
MKEPQYQPWDRRASIPPPAHLPVRPAQPITEAAIGGGVMLDIPRLLRKYALLAVLLTVIGAALGFLAAAYLPPIYKARARLEVKPLNSGVLKVPTIEDEGGQIDLQTEAQIVTSITFLRKVVERLQLESLPPAPVQTDIFSKMRRRLRPHYDDESIVNVSVDGLDIEKAPKPLAMALDTVEAHAVDRTRILEITCDSTNPQFAARFLNTIADEYIQQNQQNFFQTAQSTREWLSQQLQESKDKMLDAEKRLQQFVQESGNMFASQLSSHDGTLAESQLVEFQERLNSAEADLITKQTRYEMIKKATPEVLPDILDDATVNQYRHQIADLRREEAPLLTTLTPEHPRVKKIESQIAELQSNQKRAVESIVARAAAEYDAAKRNRDLLAKAYAAQSGRVGAQAGKEAEYNALKRESESARQTYNNLLIQSNQAGIIGSVPVNNVWLVDPSVPPPRPAKPKPFLVIAIGAFAGLGVCCGIVFLRESLNQRVSSPGLARQMFNVPQLGVIPSVEKLRDARSSFRSLAQGPVIESGIATNALVGPAAASNFVAAGTPLLAESFRVTLASLLRGQGGLGYARVILVTSSGPAEGKTTITCNLGMALAETGRSVLIVDADFRRPNAHVLFGIPNERGIVDILAETTPISEYKRNTLCVPTSTANLYLLPNGSRSENIAKALYSPRLRELIDRLRNEFDAILIDSSPMLHIADARIISTLVDGVVLVLRSGVTERKAAAEMLDQLRGDHSVVLGTVLNDWKSKSNLKNYGYYTAAPGPSDRS